MGAELTPLEAEIQRLELLQWSEFKRAVDADLRGAVEDEQERETLAEALRSDAVVPRWHGALSSMLRSVEGQLASQTADYKAKREYHQRKLEQAELVLLALEETGAGDADVTRQRSRVETHANELVAMSEKYWKDRVKKLRFRTGVSETLAEATTLSRSLEGGMVHSRIAQERNLYAERVRELEDGIRLHRDRVNEVVNAEHLTDDEIDDALWNLLQRSVA